MKNILFFIPILFFLNLNEIKVISYNIRYDNPNDGVNIWDNRKLTVTKFIINEIPDFAGLQEVTYPQLTFLSESLMNYDYIGVGRDDGKTKGEYSPIFYNKNKYKVMLENTFWLSPTPNRISIGWDASMERICTYGLFKNIETQQKIWVFNTHFDHKGTQARKKSTDLILHTIKSKNEENFPVILTGDFNLGDDSLSIQKIQNQMKDVLIGINKSNKYYGTYNGFQFENINEKRIDYIFTKDLIQLKAEHIHLKTPYKGWASDHHPVLAILKL